MILLLVIDEKKSHYVYIKDFDRFMFHKAKNKNKKYFCKSWLQCFGSKNELTEHKRVWLSINSAQFVNLEKGPTEFEYYFKQIPVPFKVYTDFENNLKSVENCEGSYLKKHQAHIPCSFAYKLVCVDDKLSKPIVIFRGENAAYEFNKAILKEYKFSKKVMKKYFNKSLIIAEEEEQFQSSNTFRICEKLIENIVTRNNIVWKLARGYCLCYCKTFSLVPDYAECTKLFTEECSSALLVPPKIK